MLTKEDLRRWLGYEEWQRDALCAQTDPDAFFPEKGRQSKPGKRVCLKCPVREACLAYALEHNERFGIWGGLSESERRKIQRQDSERVTGGEAA